MKKKIAIIAFTAVCLVGAAKFQKSKADMAYGVHYNTSTGCTECVGGGTPRCNPVNFLRHCD